MGSFCITPVRERIIDTSEKIKNTKTLTVTTVGPVWNSNEQAAKKPITKQTTESAAEHMITDLKLRQTRIDVSAGKIINPEIIIAEFRSNKQ